MAFDTNAFMQAKFQVRTAELNLPSLQVFFGESEPVWVVRGMNSNEMARSMEAVSRQKTIDSVIQALGSNKAKIDELRTALGLGDDVPGEIAKRLSQLEQCSVSPKIDLPIAVKLAETFPVEFYQLTNRIVELTGMGMDLKKSQASGETPPSET